MADVRWPDLFDQDRWLIDAMDRQVRDSRQSVEELRKRARELRDQAKSTDIRGIRTASVALAERYEQEADSRLDA